MEQFFHHWNVFDYVLAFIFCVSVILSFFRGFLQEIISLVTWFLAFYLALQFSPALSGVLRDLITHPKTAYVIAFALIFIIVMILGWLLKKMAGGFVKITFLGFFDKILGIVFGVLRGLFFIVLILFIIQLTPMQHSAWVGASQVAPHFASILARFSTFVPKQKVLTFVTSYIA